MGRSGEQFWNDPEVVKVRQQMECQQQASAEVSKLHAAGKISVSDAIRDAETARQEAEDLKLDASFAKLDRAPGVELMAVEREAQQAGLSLLHQRRDPARPPASVLLAKRGTSTARKRKWRMTSKGRREEGRRRRSKIMSPPVSASGASCWG
jgi:hypothetical protein